MGRRGGTGAFDRFRELYDEQGDLVEAYDEDTLRASWIDEGSL